MVGSAIGALVGSSHALAAELATSSTIADSTFGEGGTKESLTNEKHEVLIEIWRDRNGITRERYEAPGGGEQYWGFYFQDGSSSSDWGGSLIAVWPMERPQGRWEMRVYAPGSLTLKEYSFLSREELDREFAYWHGQMRGWVNGFIRAQAGNG